MKSGLSLTPVFVLVIVSVLLAGCGMQPATPSPTAVLPSPTPAGPYLDVTTDVVFATPFDASASEWELDIYAPREPGPWPVVLFTHGFGGNRKGYVELSEAIAEQGAVVLTFDWPAMVEDIAMRDDGRGFREMTETVACAIRFARAKALQFGGDPQRVTLGGHSYGGFISAWFSLASEDSDRLWAEFADSRGGPPPQVECVGEGESSHVNAVIGLAGGYSSFDVPRYWESDPELMALIDPYEHIGRNRGLLVRLIHGEKDELVPMDHATDLNTALAEAGYDTEVILWDGGHGVPIELVVREIMDVAGG